MSCCGQRRSEWSGQSAGKAGAPSATASVAPAVPWNAAAGVVRVRYLESVPVRVAGRHTGRHYLFSKLNPVQDVDSRDAQSLLSTRYFRREA